MWVLAHLGIQGNKRADKLQKKKKTAKKENVEINIKLSKGKSIVGREINKKWPQQWVMQ